MTDADHALGSRERTLYVFAAGAAVLTCAVSMLVLSGWWFDVEWLRSIGPGATTMKPVTALSLVLASVALGLQALPARGPHRAVHLRASLVLAVVVWIIAAVTLIDYAFGFDLRLHGTFLWDLVLRASGGSGARMQPQSAIGLLLLSISLTTFTWPREGVKSDPVFLLPVLFFGLLSLSSYVFNAPELRNFLGYTGFALQTGVCFVALSAGILAVRGPAGVLGLLASETLGGDVARRLLPTIVLMPLLVGFVSLQGERLDWYDSEFGTAIATVITTGIFAYLVWWTARIIAHADEQRQRTSATLARREGLFRGLIENSADAVALMRPDGTFAYQSPSASRVLGVPPDTLIDQPYEPTLHPDDVASARDTFENVVARREDRVTREVRFRHGDGTWHWMEATLTNMLHDPHVTAIVSNYRDVTDRNTALAALRESEARFRQMAEHIEEAFFVMDLRRMETLYLSPMWSRIWGVPLEDGYRLGWTSAVHQEDREAVDAAFRRNRDGETTDVTFRIRRPAGKARWVRARGYPVHDADGAVYRVVGVAADITELRETESRFLQAQKMEAVGQLAGGIAHDFNNLLTVILGEAEIALLRGDSPGPVTSSLHGIHRAGQSAAALTRQLLTFSRRQLVEVTDFTLNEAIDRPVALLRRLLGEHIELETRLAQDAGMVRADPGQIEQLLMNLAVNARDAMPSGGRLLIETGRATLDDEYARSNPGAQAGEYVLLSVTDNGTGMAPDVRERIFEPFFTTKERGHGTGLGLATVHGIVKQFAGHITVYSEVGVGSTFRVYLPRVMEPASLAAREKAIVPRGGSEIVLVVEDEEAVREVTSRLLRQLGYVVLEAADADTALAMLAAPGAHIDLLLTDVVLPRVSGRVLAERVQALRPAARVLYTTGYSDDVSLRHQLIAQDVLVLPKPYTRIMLAHKVREALDGAHPSDS